MEVTISKSKTTIDKLKCAELLRNDCGKYSFVCNICGDLTCSATEIINHVEQEHFKNNCNAKSELINKPTEKECDPLGDETAADYTITDIKTEEEEDTASTHINFLEVKVLEVPVNDNDTPKITHKYKNKALCNSKSPYPCPICGRILSRKTSLPGHMKVHKKVIQNRPSSCQICGMTLPNEYLLALHMESHKIADKKAIEKSKSLECQICDKSFTRKVNLKDHLLMHADIKRHKCRSCDAAYYTRSGLKAHTVIHNENAPKYTCDICQKTFREKSNMEQHIRRLHVGDKPEVCVLCGRRFLYPNELKLHLESHNVKPSHQCSECGKVFMTSILLKQHIRSVHVDLNIVCISCGKTFRTQNSYMKHTKVHAKN